MVHCSAQGIVFRDLTLEAACRQAASEGKSVFVDCYTSWCGPCRQMATREFVKPEAGAYFNDKFVCVKYDMERGEGVQLKERFKVTAYPTFLILKSDGTEMGRLVGGSEILSFIEKVEYLLKPENSLILKRENAIRPESWTKGKSWNMWMAFTVLWISITVRLPIPCSIC